MTRRARRDPRPRVRGGRGVLGLASVQVGSMPTASSEHRSVRERVVRRIREVARRPCSRATRPRCSSRTGTTTTPTTARRGSSRSTRRTPAAGTRTSSPSTSGRARVQDVYDIWLGWTNEPNHVEDVTGYFATKVEALAKHDSQLAEGIRFFEEMLGEEAVEAGRRSAWSTRRSSACSTSAEGAATATITSRKSFNGSGKRSANVARVRSISDAHLLAEHVADEPTDGPRSQAVDEVGPRVRPLVAPALRPHVAEAGLPEGVLDRRRLLEPVVPGRGRAVGGLEHLAGDDGLDELEPRVLVGVLAVRPGREPDPAAGPERASRRRGPSPPSRSGPGRSCPSPRRTRYRRTGGRSPRPRRRGRRVSPASR